MAIETVVFKLWIHGPLENTLTTSNFVTEKMNNWISDMLIGSQVWLFLNNWDDYKNRTHTFVNIYNKATLWFTTPPPPLFGKLLFLSLDILRVQFRPSTFNCFNLVSTFWKWLHVALAPTSLIEIDWFLWNSFQIEWRGKH